MLALIVFSFGRCRRTGNPNIKQPYTLTFNHAPFVAVCAKNDRISHLFV